MVRGLQTLLLLPPPLPPPLQLLQWQQQRHLHQSCVRDAVLQDLAAWQSHQKQLHEAAHGC
jgi:hypothetical protein